MTNHSLSEIIVVLDRSGSMSSIKRDMEGGFDAFIAKQKETPKDCRVTLVQFGDTIETVYSEVPIRSVPPLSLMPRGSTALLDAIGHTINSVGERLRRRPEAERPHQVVFVIVTDGGENASREFSSFTIQQMTRTQRDVFSWEFVYLGANQDAFAVAAAMGIHHNTVTYRATRTGARGLWAAASAGIDGYLCSNEQKTSGIINQASYQAAVDAQNPTGAQPVVSPASIVIPTPTPESSS